MRTPFEFREIELPRDADVCLRFWRDAYVCSFDDPDKYRTWTDEQYLEWLTAHTAKFPACCGNLISAGEVAGQVVMNPRPDKPRGHVSLFCLVPALRGSGAGDALHNFVVAAAADAGVRKLQLNVSPSNTRAIRYYLKHGWIDLGPQPGHDEVRLMELTL